MFLNQFMPVTLLMVTLLCATTPVAGKTNTHSMHYSIIMSENDALCGPLQKFYNAHLSDEDDMEKGYIEDRLGEQLNDPSLHFLIGDHPFHDVPNDWQDQLFHTIDIYNNGNNRDVIIRDAGINWKFITFQSQLLVLKKAANAPRLTFNTYNERDPAFEVSVDFSKGGSSTNQTKLDPTYSLRKYPHFAQLMEKIAPNSNVPIIGQGMAQRIVVSQGRVFVSARERGKEPHSKVLVYALDATGAINDTCYLELN